jgi:hypothetical protein
MNGDPTTPTLDVPRHGRRWSWRGLVLLFSALLFLLPGAVWLWVAFTVPEPAGVWAVSPRQLRAVNAKARPGKVLPGPGPFRFGGDSVYLQLFPAIAWQRAPKDNIWRLRARWKDNGLYGLWPDGRWCKVGTFVNGHFEVRKGGGTWAMERVRCPGPGGPEWQMLWDRPAWHYPELEWDRGPLDLTLEQPGPSASYSRIEPPRVLRDEPDPIFAICPHPVLAPDLACSPDGRRLAAAGSSWDPDAEMNVGYVKVWNTTSGKAEGLLEPLPGPVRGVAFGPDSRRLALASEDCTVRVWDAIGRRELLVLAGHPVAVCRVAFSPDGQQLASGDEDGRVIVWDAATGETRAAFKAHSRRVTSLAFAPGGEHLLSSGYEDGVKVWTVANGIEETYLPMSNDSWCVAVAPDGRRGAAGGYNCVSVWDVSRRQVRREQLAEGGVTALACSPDGRYIAVGGDRGWVVLWEATTCTRLLTIRRYRQAVGGLAFSPDGRRLVSSGRGGTIEVWDMAGLLASKPAAR